MKTQTLTREEFIAQFIARQEQERANCAAMRKDPQACATVLWKLACDDTSGSRAASALLLSLWNNHFAANMRDVMGNLDIKHTEAGKTPSDSRKAMTLLTGIITCVAFDAFIHARNLNARRLRQGGVHQKIQNRS